MPHTIDFAERDGSSTGEDGVAFQAALNFGVCETPVTMLLEDLFESLGIS